MINSVDQQSTFTLHIKYIYNEVVDCRYIHPMKTRHPKGLYLLIAKGRYNNIGNKCYRA